MSQLGHVWTAPWQELSDLMQHGRVRSRVRPVDAARVAAGPNALRGSGPNRSHAFEYALTQAGSPDPGTTVSALRRHALANSLELSARVGYAASKKYLISPASVDKHIAYIEEVRQVSSLKKATTSHDRRHRQATTCRDLSRQPMSNSSKARTNFSEAKWV